jgi:hypothetical protein
MDQRCSAGGDLHPEVVRALGRPGTHVGPGYCGLIQHEMAQRARAWSVATIRGRARHCTMGVIVGLARPAVERATPGPG